MPLRTTFHSNNYDWQQVDKHDPCIAPLKCCGKIVRTQDRICPQCKKEVMVTVCGKRNPSLQEMRYPIFSGTETEPCAYLTCRFCLSEVKTKEMRCQCGAVCSVHLKYNRDAEQWEIHREVEQYVENEFYSYASQRLPDGIIMLSEMKAPKRKAYIPPDPPPAFEMNPKLMLLSCPFPHQGYYGMTFIDRDGCCRGHNVKIIPVMVLKDTGVFIETRAYNTGTTEDPATGIKYEKGQLRDIPKKQSIQLRCPYCRQPIRDKTLKCCYFIIDVVQKPPIQKYIDPNTEALGTNTYIWIEIEPRWASDTTRPPNAIQQEGDNWTDPEQTHVHEQTQTQQQKMDDATIYQLYLDLKAEDPSISQRKAAKIIGIPRSTLNAIIKREEAKRAAAESVLTKDEQADMDSEVEQEVEPLKKQLGWF